MKEFLDQPSIAKLKLYAALHLDPIKFHLDPLEGGFAQSDKYVVRDSAGTPVSFAKIMSKAAANDEISVMSAEIQNYRLLHELALTGSVFPSVLSEVDNEDYIGLTLDYYDNVSWGGPWTEASIKNVYAMLTRIHATPLSDTQKQILFETKRGLIPISEQYQTAKQSFHDTRTIINSRRQTIFVAPDDSLFRALFDEAPTPDTDDLVLIAQDVNKYNICIEDDATTHIVDPVYLNIGNPYQDFLNIGHDIIQTLPPGSQELALTKDLFMPDDRHNIHLLNGFAYGLMAIQQSYDDNAPWMDYQQQALLTKLRLWYGQL